MKHRLARRYGRTAASATHLSWTPNGFDKGSYAVSGDYFLKVFFLPARRDGVYGRWDLRGDHWGWTVERGQTFIAGAESALSESEAKTTAEGRWAIDRINPKKGRKRA